MIERDMRERELPVIKQDKYICEYRDNEKCEYAFFLRKRAMVGEEDPAIYLEEFCSSGLKYTCKYRDEIKRKEERNNG